jgi:trk system potassium uptake protein TrkA
MEVNAMYIVIAGGGVFGQALAHRLVENRHDVVLIERDKAICELISAKVGALAIHGTATSIDVLDDAGIERAEVAIGALPSDADNLAFTLLAKKFDVPRVFVRMRDPRYDAAYKLAGVSIAVSVSELFVGQLTLEIEQPSLRQVATFGGGKAAIVVATVPERARVHGQTVQEVVKAKGFPEECVIAGIFRRDAEEFIFPRGGIKLLEGDQVFLAADASRISAAAAHLQRTKR